MFFREQTAFGLVDKGASHLRTAVTHIQLFFLNQPKSKHHSSHISSGSRLRK